MRAILSVLLVFAYFVGGSMLYLRASRYLKDATGPFSGYQIWHRKYYTELGQGPRLTAVRFYLLGGLVLLAGLWLLNG